MSQKLTESFSGDLGHRSPDLFVELSPLYSEYHMSAVVDGADPQNGGEARYDFVVSDLGASKDRETPRTATLSVVQNQLHPLDDQYEDGEWSSELTVTHRETVVIPHGPVNGAVPFARPEVVNHLDFLAWSTEALGRTNDPAFHALVRGSSQFEEAQQIVEMYDTSIDSPGADVIRRRGLTALGSDPSNPTLHGYQAREIAAIDERLIPSQIVSPYFSEIIGGVAAQLYVVNVQNKSAR